MGSCTSSGWTSGSCPLSAPFTVPIQWSPLTGEESVQMVGVDLYDQLASYYSFEHRTVKWWRRAFFHLLDTAIINAYILYKQSRQSSRKLTHLEFRVELAKGLLEEAGVTPNSDTAPTLRSVVVPPPIRLSGRHFPEKALPTASGRPRQLECVVGSRKKGRGKVTTTFKCDICSVALCIVPCFKLYHTHTDPTRHLDILNQTMIV